MWMVQGFLALAFVAGGSFKVFANARARRLPWAEKMSKKKVMFIGISELLGGLGLVVPQVTGIAPVLTLTSAIGLATITVLAAELHLRRRETGSAIGALIFLGLVAFVVHGRLYLLK